MLDRLFEHVVACNAEGIGLLTLQDAAICTAWYTSFPEKAPEREQWNALPGRIAQWRAAEHLSDPNTEGRRHQWVLRDLVDVLQQGGPAGLERDELDLLITVHQLLSQGKNGESPSRMFQLVNAHMEAIRLAAHEARAAGPGLPSISKRLHVVTEADLKAARPRDIQVFAGLAIPHRGPVYAHRSGHVKVLGSIPENCVLVVENGSCSVDGFLMGKVATTRHCEVRENISGVVVTRMGDVRARNIILPAVIVSKWGRVHCRKAEFPELVFAGKEIRVSGSIVLGRYFSPRIRVNGTVTGGEFHVTRLLAAEQFNTSDSRTLSIIMRRELSCHDYGEEPGPEARKLLTQAMRLRRQIASLQETRTYSHHEAERSAKLAVIYLCGGESNHPIAERIQACESRMIQLHRIVSGLANLRIAAEDRLERLSRFQGKPVPQAVLSDVLEQNQANLDAAHKELKALESFDQLDADLNEEVKALSAIRDNLTMPQREVGHVINVLEQIWDHTTRWLQEQATLEASIRDYETQLQDILGENAAAAGARPDNATYAGILRRLLLASKNRPAGTEDKISRRLKTGFVRVAVRNVTTSLERVRNIDAEIAACIVDLRTVRQTLQEEYQLNVGDDDDKESAARITGRFQAGVRIFADIFFFNSNVKSGHGVAITQDSHDTPVTYGKVAGSIVGV